MCTQVRRLSSAFRSLTRATGTIPSSVALVGLPVIVESVTAVRPLENDLTQVLTDGTYTCRASEIVRWISVGVCLRRRWNLMIHRISSRAKELSASATSIHTN